MLLEEHQRTAVLAIIGEHQTLSLLNRLWDIGASANDPLSSKTLADAAAPDVYEVLSNLDIFQNVWIQRIINSCAPENVIPWPQSTLPSCMLLLPFHNQARVRHWARIQAEAAPLHAPYVEDSPWYQANTEVYELLAAVFSDKTVILSPALEVKMAHIRPFLMTDRVALWDALEEALVSNRIPSEFLYPGHFLNVDFRRVIIPELLVDTSGSSWNLQV